MAIDKTVKMALLVIALVALGAFITDEKGKADVDSSNLGQGRYRLTTEANLCSQTGDIVPGEVTLGSFVLFDTYTGAVYVAPKEATRFAANNQRSPVVLSWRKLMPPPQ